MAASTHVLFRSNPAEEMEAPVRSFSEVADRSASRFGVDAPWALDGENHGNACLQSCQNYGHQVCSMHARYATDLADGTEFIREQQLTAQSAQARHAWYTERARTLLVRLSSSSTLFVSSTCSLSDLRMAVTTNILFWRDPGETEALVRSFFPAGKVADRPALRFGVNTHWTSQGQNHGDVKHCCLTF